MKFLTDAVLVGAGLVIFSYFHHVRPVILNQSGYGSENVGGFADFSEKFADKFTSGEIVKGDGIYKSANISVTLTKHQGKNSDGDPLCWFEADVYVRNVGFLRTAFAGGVFARGLSDTVPAMAKKNGAVLAVNGDYFGVRDKGRVIRNGVVYRDTLCYQVCALYADGTMETYRAGEFDIEKAIKGGVWQAWDFGPELLDNNGKAFDEFKTGIAGKNPRCAIGYYEPGHYCMILIDGRQEGYSMGVTLKELAGMFEQMGCSRAYNLDGGMSANMAFDGKLVNAPAKGGRSVSDIFYVTDEPQKEETQDENS